MPTNAPNLLVYFAMVSDGPTTLGLRPQNENLHLEECSEWVQFPCFIHRNRQHQAGDSSESFCIFPDARKHS